MKESNNLAYNVAMNLPVRVILRNTKEQFMKESNNFAYNAAMNVPDQVILHNIKEQFNL